MTDVNEIECPKCGNIHGSKELCECGYDPELCKGKEKYSAKHALTATLDLVPNNKGSNFVSEIGLEWKLDTEDVVQFITRADKKFMGKRKSHGVMKKDLMPLNTPSVFWIIY